MAFDLKVIKCDDGIESLFPVSGNAVTYDKLEIGLSVPCLDGNFYDESENSVTGRFTGPGGISFEFPGFYYEPYDFRSTGELLGRSAEAGSWRIRVMIPESGKWRLEITVRHGGEICACAECEFRVAEGNDFRGVIGVEPTVKRNFAFQNGELYIPIGQNLCWHKPVSSSEKQARYINRVISAGSDYGMNFVRLWLMYWGLSIKTQNCAPNDFSGGQSNAAQLDRIFDKLAEKDVYASLVFFTHGDFSTVADSHWFECPYNAVNPHGYLEKPQDFWNDGRARNDAKSYIRYLVARYGYSRNIMTWELFNEADGVDGRDYDAAAEWHGEMSGYIRSIDPYKHMISTSACYTDGRIARHEAMDFTFIHCYNYPEIDYALSFQRKDWENRKRPSIFGEIGFMSFKPHIRESLIAPHMSNWAGVMGGSAATGMTWYWEQFDEADGYSIYAPLSEFAAKIPWLNPTLKTAVSRDFNGNDDRVRIIGYTGEGFAYLWLYDNKLSPDKENYTDFTDYRFRFPTSPGEYTAEWLNTRTGTPIKTETVKTENGILGLCAPAWRGDIALSVKIK